jgi:exosortase/archaeosortase family protein
MKKKTTIILKLSLFLIITYALHKTWWFGIKYFRDFQIYEILAGSLQDQVFATSYWINTKIFGLDLSKSGHTMYFHPGYIEINQSCSGLKQQYQWIFLTLLFPSSIQQKLTWLPAGMLIMYGVNILRILILSLILIWIPGIWDVAHDWVLRPGFYVVIFLMWQKLVNNEQ